MLDATLKTQLKSYLEKVVYPLELVASLDDSAKAREMKELLQEIVLLSDKITLVERTDAGVRTPSFSINRPGTDIGVRFAGVPLGHEFTSLVLALLQVGGHTIKFDDAVIEQIRNLDGDYEFETFISLSCHNCPEVVQALNAMAVINPRIKVTTIDGGVFPQEVEARQIMAVPMMFLNGEHFGQGRTNVEEILAKLDTNAGARQAEALNKKDVFDVLIVGGGPAGAAAAIYAARKGIKTGVLAERFGGQVLDTLAIENFISVKETDGPKFAMALEQHVKEYEVDIMNTQRAAKLTPGKLVQIETANGAILKAKTVILATGARWREINVPGEKEYRNHGVAYCPHCDGPLFKGKRVAVIGGGNSGVEAAIDLAGLVKHVTLIEFGAELRADAVLQRKLHSLPNVTVITSAQTTEIHGDGKIVNGLSYTDRVSGESKKVELEGVFVQIGLVPNTEWLKGTVALSRHGEIEVDARGQTSIPGVFAAGDVTTVPYKQIIIATGEGAKAALSAFDHLIRSDDEEVVEESAAKEALTA
ncbi:MULTISPECIES: alkyl hydroperoxide reductase subunit F [Janthinobacterium]|uniref:Alkyl hydroperoxide reductase subunit F n=1 Tax=Janthinobacterium kumbetense TaxID=2950280 RepID=A0ABT0WZS6_9BURK|nr:MULTISPECIES: alkyl hydroperoxide reductase subunit F [Janthinobacterium]MCM2568758.1 alkyl hydroperoxide reductase subunit F [Janthinobacterium kumbetense]MDN2674687.1 alkyl hydroperoxide reductase subunit F [Janthinobacterium sp. SUN026]MDN2680582.1 alkyl hydroperoxide reductase subunit F [Janthinobacterium sp. SUN033]MDN2705962.1 alkyl hydroperoxide reductase subunit F [Janthinobacterium sp. SUN100]MDN2718733.1 alkyl hydroperoxide reductase subunit F [Janthinobacterium sp. SUN120]